MNSSMDACQFVAEKACSHEATSCGDDDVISLCSWTTDQGDFSDGDRCMPSRKYTAESQVSTNSIDSNNDSNGTPTFLCPLYSAVDNSVPVPWPMYGSYVMCFVVPPASSMVSTDGNLVPVEPPGTWSRSTMPAAAARIPHEKNKGTKARYGGSSKLGGGDPGESENTTIILRNLPLECTRNELLDILDAQGFWGCYNFLHLPVDFQTKTGLGYALLNLVNHSAASRVKSHFEGFASWPLGSENVCTVAWNSPQQGLAAHVDRYRNSPLMHASVPEEYRPVLFKNGVCANFPRPTARIRAPRIRHSKTPQLESITAA